MFAFLLVVDFVCGWDIFAWKILFLVFSCVAFVLGVGTPGNLKANKTMI